MAHVAERSRFVLDYSRVSPEQWNQASMLSRPDMLAYEPVPDSLVPVFEHIALERTSTSTPALEHAGRERSPRSASYPRAPGAAPGTDLRRPARGPHGAGSGYAHTTGREDGR